MKKFLTVLFTTFLLGTPALADTSASIKTEAWTQYHGTNGDIFDKDASYRVIPTISGDNWYVGAWVAEDNDGVADFGNEIDWFAGYANSNAYISYDVGVQYFVLHQPTEESGNVWNVYAVVGMAEPVNVAGIDASAYLRVDYYTPEKSQPVDGTIARIGVKLSKQFGNKTTLTVDPQIMHDNGAFGYESGELVQIDATLSYQFTEKWTGEVGMRHSAPLFDDPIRESNTTGMAGLLYAF